MIGKTTGVMLMCVAVTCLALTASSAYGKSVNGVIFDEAGSSFPADIALEDNDKSYVIDVDANGFVTVGDIFRGMFTVQQIRGLPGPVGTAIGAGTPHNELTAVFDIEVTAAWKPLDAGNPIPGQHFWLFGPDPLFTTGFYPGDVGMPVVGGAMIMMYDDSAQDYTDDAPGAPGSEEPALIPTAGAGNATAALWGAFGLDPNRAWDNWYTTSPTNIIAVVSNSTAPGYGVGPMASGGFITSLIPTGGLADNILIPNPTGSELSGSLGIYGKMDNLGVPVSTNFDFISDSDLAIRVVPTPMAIWAAMPLLGLGVFIVRRRLVC